MKELLTICTNNVHFSFNNDIYIQVLMGSLLGPIIANIFIVECESVLVPILKDHAKKWGQFVDEPLFTSSMFCPYCICFMIT